MDPGTRGKCGRSLVYRPDGAGPTTVTTPGAGTFAFDSRGVFVVWSPGACFLRTVVPPGTPIVPVAVTWWVG